MQFPDSNNRWSYLHETGQELALTKWPQVAGRANQIAVCLCQLQGVNFIRGTGPNHIGTCILPAVPELVTEWMQRRGLLVLQLDIQLDNNMEMKVSISTHSYEILAIL